MTQRSFSADLSKFGVTVDKRCTKLIRQLALETLDSFHKLNPACSGWSRASWQVTLNAPGTGVWSRQGGWVAGNSWKDNKPPMYAAIPWPDQKEKLRALTWKDKVYFTNHVPYINSNTPWGQASVEQRYGVMAKTMAEARANLATLALSMAK